MSKLKIAIQKKGRLSENSLKMLEECGIKFTNGTGKLKNDAKNFPLEVLFLRDDDIPYYVERQVADIGIVGENVVLEHNRDVETINQLNFGNCRLSLAIPREESYSSPDWFNGKRIATSYPNILGNYFKENNISAEVEVISGSVEIAPGIGLADGICDIVSTGSTLLSNGLKEVQTVMKSQAVMIAARGLDDSRKEILDRLIFRIMSTINASGKKYILLNAPDSAIDEICSILPGMKSPTILPLAIKGWNSIHSVISEDEFWEMISKLKKAGAEGILVIPIEKMIL
jgi:ATP phosphoribosyltransferase